MAEYDIEAINGCVRKAQDFTSKFGAIADEFPTGGGNSAAFGSLPSSAGVASAVSGLCAELNKEFTAAETKLGQVASALDAVSTSIQEMDQNNAASLTPSR
jgi:hypothetical protein